MSSGWLTGEADMTMGGEARENQPLAREAEDASGRHPRGVMVEAGIAVHQKNYAVERESRGKSREDGWIC
jgi:hypothetical protein